MKKDDAEKAELTPEQAREEAFDACVKELDKEYGKGTIILGQSVDDLIKRIPSGSIGLDLS